jgi:hypothetical protein
VEIRYNQELHNLAITNSHIQFPLPVLTQELDVLNKINKQFRQGYPLLKEVVVPTPVLQNQAKTAPGQFNSAI